MRFVIGRDDKGAHHYDHSIFMRGVVSYSAQTNRLTEASLLFLMGGNRGCTHSRSAVSEPCRLLSIEPSIEHQDGFILDSSAANVNREVLNLFIEGEEPEAVENAPDTNEPTLPPITESAPKESWQMTQAEFTASVRQLEKYDIIAHKRTSELIAFIKQINRYEKKLGYKDNEKQLLAVMT